MVMPSYIMCLATMAGLVSTHANPPTPRFRTLHAKALNSSRVGHDTTLSPVINPDVDTTSIQNIVPSKNISMNWGAQGNGLVNVSLEMNHPTVLLEEIDGIATVDCESTSVSITFSDKDAFDEALEDWSDDDSFILVTNHLGDCDAENERGFFLAQSITSDSDSLTVVASGEKSDIESTAGLLRLTLLHYSEV